VVLWELSGAGEDRQRRALRLIGGAFIILAAYLAIQSAVALAARYHPGHSQLGIAWTAVTAAAMFALAAGKARTGKELRNPVLAAEGRVTLVDGILPVAVLAGLILSAGAEDRGGQTRSPPLSSSSMRSAKPARSSCRATDSLSEAPSCQRRPATRGTGGVCRPSGCTAVLGVMRKTSRVRDSAAAFPLPSIRDDAEDQRAANRAVAVSAACLPPPASSSCCSRCSPAQWACSATPSTTFPGFGTL
jgi:hypothetical protein